MAIWGDAAQWAAAVNIVIMLALCSVWLRNYRQFRSKHALGLLVFGYLVYPTHLVQVTVWLSIFTISVGWLAFFLWKWMYDVDL